MASKYTAEDRQRIREHHIETGGNDSKTARDLGIPRSTVRAIAQGRSLVTTIEAVDEDAVLWGKASRTVAQRIAEVAPQSEDLGQLAAAARAATAAHLDYRDGRKGATNVHIGDNNQTLVIEYAEDWRS